MVDTAVLEQEGPELKHRHGPFHVDQKKKSRLILKFFFTSNRIPGSKEEGAYNTPGFTQG